MLTTASEVPQPTPGGRWFSFWRSHLWRYNRLSAILDLEHKKSKKIGIEEMELDFQSSFENLLSTLPTLEQLLVSKIQSMTSAEKTLVLESIPRFLTKYLEVGCECIPLREFDPHLWDLISIMTEATNSLDKKFLFYCFGLILRETLENMRKHLYAILELSHQMSCQREGIALAVGLASSRHLGEAWAALEQFGQRKIVKFGPNFAKPQIIPDIYWKWASSTVILCCGQMAIHAKKSILPWVDIVIARMVFYFNCSKYDDILKNSFLIAAGMITTVLKKESEVKSYTSKQLPALIDCIMISIQKEPREFFDPYFQQKSLQVISTLSYLQPCFTAKLKTKMLVTCFESLFMLPATEKLKSTLPGQKTPNDVENLYTKTMEILDLLLQSLLSQHQTMEELQFLLQHFEPWLMTDELHERFRAIQTALKLLQYSQEKLNLNSETSLEMMGHHLALFSLLWWDESVENQLCARHCILLLIKLLTQKRTEERHGCLYSLKQMRNLDKKFLKEVNKNCSQLVKAMNTIYELLYIQEFRKTVHWAFSGIFFGLLTQLHYLFELNMVDESLDHFEDALNLENLSPFRTCLEALKGLFWTTDNWEVFAYMKLQEGWNLFMKMNTFIQGVTLLTRAITHYNCEIKNIFNHVMLCMKSPCERDHLVGILVITELLNSQHAPRFTSRQTIESFLTLSLSNSNKVVQTMSLQGLGSLLLQPEKRDLLQNQLSHLMAGLLLKEEENILVLMNIIGDILHRLTLQGAGSNSLKVAEQLFDLFDDEREKVRGEAIFLYGNVIYSAGKKYEQQLKTHAFQCLVPLLFHLVDPCPEVVMKTKSTFMRLAILFKWCYRKDLFTTLAWREGLRAESDIFLYMVESNFGEYHLFLLQAFRYVKSPQKYLQRAAMKFIGAMLQEYFPDLCFYLNKSDVKLVTKKFEELRRDEDPSIRKFYLNYSENIYELSRYVF
ncbi:maestro heat-like repeat family member 5 [Macrotis lagotis]|uniref:maestro heat-like repeat family member 5 n=1 Tax=Macrotis lagotis TaxID=92651 RepID=UPI003D696E0E